jgi:hypothetical protein
MSAKSGHGRRKLPRSKRKKGRKEASVISAQQPVIAHTPRPISQPKASVPPAKAPATVATLAATRYPYITAELRRIGILAGVVLVILVILALVFS